MNKYLCIFFPILFLSSGELCLKFYLNSLMVSSGDGGWMQTVHFIVETPGIIFAFFLIFLGATFWIYALSRFDISYIYPFFSFNFVVVMIGSSFLLGEEIGWNRIVVVFMIILGILVISRSPNAERKEVKDGI